MQKSLDSSAEEPYVLIVEDDDLIRNFLKRKFQEENIRTSEAKDGDEALRMAAEHFPAIVLLDILLPNTINGFEVLERLKQNSATAHIPVVILTNLGQSQDIARGRALGAVDFLVKAHVSPNDVVVRVRELLAKAS